MNKKNYLPLILVAVIILFAWKVYGREEKHYPVRQNWEYKFIHLYRGVNQEDTKWTQMLEDGTDITSTSLPLSITKKTKELGEQGWELISVTAVSSSYHAGWTNYNHEDARPETTPSYAGFTNSVYYWFKRPK